jgi:hypothetical protein
MCTCAFTAIQHLSVCQEMVALAMTDQSRYPPGDSPDSCSSWIRCGIWPQGSGLSKFTFLQGERKFERSQASLDVQRVAV